MILHLGFDICVEADNGHKAHCTIVQESGKESKSKRVVSSHWLVFVELECQCLHVRNRGMGVYVAAHGIHEQFAHGAERLQVWIG